MEVQNNKLTVPVMNDEYGLSQSEFEKDPITLRPVNYGGLNSSTAPISNSNDDRSDRELINRPSWPALTVPVMNDEYGLSQSEFENDPITLRPVNYGGLNSSAAPTANSNDDRSERELINRPSSPALTVPVMNDEYGLSQSEFEKDPITLRPVNYALCRKQIITSSEQPLINANAQEKIQSENDEKSGARSCQNIIQYVRRRHKSLAARRKPLKPSWGRRREAKHAEKRRGRRAKAAHAEVEIQRPKSSDIKAAKLCSVCGKGDLKFDSPSPTFCNACGSQLNLNDAYYAAKANILSSNLHAERVRPQVCGASSPSPALKIESPGKDKLEGGGGDDDDDDDAPEIAFCKACFTAARKEKKEIVDVSSSAGIPAQLRVPQSGKLWDHLKKLQRKVEEAKGLLVRVVSSVEMVAEFSPGFCEIVQSQLDSTDNLPGLPYRSKMVMLFQDVGGVDICLLAMYVQEYGEKAYIGHPNYKSVVIAYIESVKYFEPADVTTVHGEALRTFVYHQILIGYLKHARLRGFENCHKWASPPAKKGDSYSHPSSQFIPQRHKLLDWYLSMIQKAKAQGVVAGHMSLFQHCSEVLSMQEKEGQCGLLLELPYFPGDLVAITIGCALDSNGTKIGDTELMDKVLFC
ncbi:hypothetical protein L7F22_038147 [Adiantum nelumboides]|nr:hypothetical protein [Adiantum nelumboides]